MMIRHRIVVIAPAQVRMNADRIDIDCPRCDGRGYPNIGQDGTLWDEETMERHVYICSRCGGTGTLRLWADDPNLDDHIAAAKAEQAETRKAHR